MFSSKVYLILVVCLSIFDQTNKIDIIFKFVF